MSKYSDYKNPSEELNQVLDDAGFGGKVHSLNINGFSIEGGQLGARFSASDGLIVWNSCQRNAGVWDAPYNLDELYAEISFKFNELVFEGRLQEDD